MDGLVQSRDNAHASWEVTQVNELLQQMENFDGVKEIPNLAPGDFRTVRQEQFYLGGEQTNLDRIAALKEECALKKDGSKTGKIGFAA